MKVKMICADWESVLVLARSFKADKMTLSQVVHVEKASDFIREVLKDYLDRKGKLIEQAASIVKTAQERLAKIQVQHIGEPNHPELTKFSEETNALLDKEINSKIAEVETKEMEMDLQDNWFESLQNSFTRQAYFGEGGYKDNHFGRAAYVRTLKGLNIPVEEVEKMEAEETKIL